MILGDYKVAIPYEHLYIGDTSFIQRYGINLKEIIFLDCVNIKNLWFGFLWTSLVLDNYSFITIIGISNFLLMTISFICIFRNLNTKEDNVKMILLTYFSQMIAYILFNIKSPYYCTLESRYILLAISLGILFAGKFYNETDSKFIKIGEYVITLVFCFFSLLSSIV